MLGRSDPAEDTAGSGFDTLALLTDTGLSRRQVLARLMGLAVTSLVPPWLSVANASTAARKPRARSAASAMGYCEAQVPGACNTTRVTWTPLCTQPIASGTTAQSNGCGPIGGVVIKGVNVGNIFPDNPLGLASFTDACNAHDCCYGTCGESKTTCDTAALQGWQQACDKRWGAAASAGAVLAIAALSYCYEVAGAYYTGVAVGGTGAFNTAQLEVCECCGCTSDGDCMTGNSCCDSSCVDTQSDPNNCGSCDHVCPQGQTCQGGQCFGCSSDDGCTGGQSCCGGTCANTQSDSSNCGGCGNACPSGESCQMGTCKPSGKKLYCGCNDTCYDDPLLCVTECHATLACFADVCLAEC